MSKYRILSSVRAATFTGDDVAKSQGARGISAYLDVTAVPGVDTVTLAIDVKDQASGKYVQVAAAAARVATGTDRLTVYPGITVAANVALSDVVGDIYRVRVVHSAASNFTYTVGIDELA
jgi:hypothetical protein